MRSVGVAMRNLATPALLLLLLLNSSACGDGTPSREAIANLFQHYEDLIGTVDSEMRVSQPATSSEDIVALQKRYASFKEGYYKRYVVSERTKAERWRRKGIKERFDGLNQRKESVSITSFDGAIVRVINLIDKSAHLGTKESESWDGMPYLDPVSLVFEFRTDRFSDIVRNGRRYEAEAVTHNGSKATRIVVSNPGRDDRERFVLLLDNKMRVVRREYHKAWPDGRSWRINDVLELWDYGNIAAGSGEFVPFPRKGRWSFYTKEQSPPPQVFNRRHIALNKIALNVNIGDAVFRPSIPTSFEVYDNITGLGWVRASDPRLPAAVRSRSYLWMWVCGVAAAVSLVGFGLWRRRAGVQ